MQQHVQQRPPIRSSQIIDEAASLWSRNFGGCVLLVLFALVLPSALAGFYYVPFAHRDTVRAFGEEEELVTFGWTLQLVFGLLRGLVALCTILLFAENHPGGAGENRRTQDLLRTACHWHPAGRFLIAGFLQGLFIVVGYILCICPGVYLTVALALVPVIVVLDKDTGVCESFGKSNSMMCRIFDTGCCIACVTPMLVGIATAVALGGVTVVLTIIGATLTAAPSTVVWRYAMSVGWQAGICLTSQAYTIALLVVLYTKLQLADSEQIPDQEEMYGRQELGAVYPAQQMAPPMPVASPPPDFYQEKTAAPLPPQQPQWQPYPGVPLGHQPPVQNPMYATAPPPPPMVVEPSAPPMMTPMQ
eukprot:TRINITY_DN112263_c0_g1_i1.p1 TRINITY_DN112263_c0_g1~~TRINITY_DN112263_c0_g1_i1.p1  ORF type:complete len:360 (+),score=46.17 TRINITY_DN112263_c0_g1_i1:33-1112(+)